MKKYLELSELKLVIKTCKMKLEQWGEGTL